MTPIEHAAIEIVNMAHTRGFCGVALEHTRDILTRVKEGTYEVPEELSPLAFEMELQAIHEATDHEALPPPWNSKLLAEAAAEDEIDNGLAKTQGAYKGRRK